MQVPKGRDQVSGGVSVPCLYVKRSIGRLCHIAHGILKFSLILYISDRKYSGKMINFIKRNYTRFSVAIRTMVMSLYT